MRRRILAGKSSYPSERNRHTGRRIRPVAISSLPKAKPVPAFSRRTIVTVAAPTARHAVRQAVKPQHHYRKTLAIILASVTSVVIAAAVCLGFVANSVYADRVLPDTTFAGHELSGMTTAQVAALITSVQNDITVTLTIDGTTKTAAGADLGIWVDGAKILTAVTKQSRNPLWVYTHSPTDIPLSVSIDKDQFNSWLTSNFPQNYTPAHDAGLSFDPATSLFAVTRSIPGTGVSTTDLDKISSDLAARSGQGSFSPSGTEPIPPLISDEQAASAQEWANQRLLAQCSFTYDDQTLYTLSQADIASLITLSPTDDGPVAAVDPARVHDFIADTLSTALTVAPTTQQLITDEQGNVLSVTQEGAPGRTLASSDSLSAQIIACVDLGEATQISVGLTDVPYSTQTSAPPATMPPPGSESAHWADVNLATQTVTLMDGYLPASTFVLSSGAPNHPTPTGVFHVYSKVFTQSLSGCLDGECYYYPGVHWATWFYKDYGFHEAYWNHEFGKPVSHGCLNLTYSDAQAVYDWLSISDAVYVH